MPQDPHEWDDRWQVEERKEELVEWRKRIPLLIDAVEDREIFLRTSGMPAKAQEFQALLEWLKSPSRLVT